MGLTTEFAAGSWIVRQPPGSLILTEALYGLEKIF
jgi:hypothetical protein